MDMFCDDIFGESPVGIEKKVIIVTVHLFLWLNFWCLSVVSILCSIAFFHYFFFKFFFFEKIPEITHQNL